MRKRTGEGDTNGWRITPFGRVLVICCSMFIVLAILMAIDGGELWAVLLLLGLAVAALGRAVADSQR